MKTPLGFLLSLLFATGLVLSGVSSVQANMAANSRIVNTAVLTYNIGSLTTTIQASATVTIALVPALPTVTASDALTPYVGPASTVVIPCTVTSNSNGAENYTLNPAVANSTNTAGAMLSGPVTFELGATVTIPGSSQTLLLVPSDGVTDGSINGLTVGETVVISGEVRIITALDDPASGTAVITLDRPLSNPPLAGVLVGEQRLLTVTVTSGQILNNGADLTAVIGATVSNGLGTTSASVTATVTFTSSTTTMAIYARNLSRDAANAPASGGRDFTINGNATTYYLNDVTAQQGEAIEYVLEMRNTGNGTASDCAIINQFPTSVPVTVSANSYPGGDLWSIDENGATRSLTWGNSDDAATLSGSVLRVNVGSGADPAHGGSLTAGQRVIVAYRVTIDN